MEQTATMPSAHAVPQATPMPADAAKAAKKKDHWMVEVAGGVTLGSTIMAALALWTVLVSTMMMS